MSALYSDLHLKPSQKQCNAVQHSKMKLQLSSHFAYIGADNSANLNRSTNMRVTFH
uniref:Uncharacterized protein n=1 Tax=Arion vulgaris TaxID=1028688 RepID=A0A0B6ZRW2_9EUPU